MKIRRTSPVKIETADFHVCDVPGRLNILRKVPFFTDLAEKDLTGINNQFTDLGFQSGEIICLKGQDAERLYIVASGKVKILHNTLDGQEVLLDILSPGEYFGSLSSMGAVVYSNTAQALTGVCILSIDSHKFKGILTAYPTVALKVLEITGERLAEAQEKIQQLSAFSVPRRIAFVLLKLSDKLGAEHDTGRLIEVPLTREDLAAMTGTTLESVSRTLSQFKKEGWINTGRQWIALKNPAELKKITEN